MHKWLELSVKLHVKRSSAGQLAGASRNIAWHGIAASQGVSLVPFSCDFVVCVLAGEPFALVRDIELPAAAKGAVTGGEPAILRG